MFLFHCMKLHLGRKCVKINIEKFLLFKPSLHNLLRFLPRRRKSSIFRSTILQITRPFPPKNAFAPILIFDAFHYHFVSQSLICCIVCSSVGVFMRIRPSFFYTSKSNFCKYYWLVVPIDYFFNFMYYRSKRFF